MLTPISEIDLGGAIASCFTDESGAGQQLGSALYMPVQTHTDHIAMVEEGQHNYPNTDALISMLPGTAVGVRTADCIPVLIYAPDIRAVAAVHAGWKGTFAGITAKTVKRLARLGADPTLMRATIMPGICGNCYEVGHDLYIRFFPDAIPSTVRPHLDLPGINNNQLLCAGLQSANIHISTLCTLHSPCGLHSYRRNATTSRNLSLIKLET